jgi:subtilase family serine protease
MNRVHAAVLAGALLILIMPAPAVATPDTTLHTACTATTSTVHCFAHYRSSGSFGPQANPPAGYGPADLRDAYKLPLTGGAGQTIAIVDAFDNPNAETDLAIYRQQYGLPACTTANGCFKKINQRGQASPLPTADAGWGVEIALDVDMVSAACPSCDILLVEGDDATFEDLGAAVDQAVKSGAAAVSNSYGADEFRGMDTAAAHYVHPGVPILASSGDDGFRAASFPAVLNNVIAVGGTSLARTANARGWSETAWSGAGSACSAWIPKPAWQHDDNCRMRTVADVSAVADPRTGVAVYDTFDPGVPPGWLVVGGTSASSPFVAGVFGVAGNARSFNNASSFYNQGKDLFDVVGGSNGFCGGDYLCTGLAGYDAPTGMGSPNGTTAF